MSPMSQARIDGFNPWKTIWLHPKETVRQALKTETKWPIILSFLFGIGMFLDNASNINLGDQIPVNFIFLLSLIIGPIIGFLGWMIVSGVVYWTARLFKGDGTWEDTKLAIAWGTIPYVAKVFLWVPQLLFFGSELFTKEMPILQNDFFLLIIFVIFQLVEIILLVWFYITLSHCIGVAQRISAWKGFASYILFPMVFFVLLLILIIFS